MYKNMTYAMPQKLLDGIDELLKGGHFANKSEVVRTAVRELIERTHNAEVNQKALGTEATEIAPAH